MHAVLYGRGGKRWAMTERRASALVQADSQLVIGPSSMRWDGTALEVALDEVTAPLPGRIRGTVRLHPAALNPRGFRLDAKGRQRWRPIAPLARVEVTLQRPALRWSGPAYFDTNEGDAPLEEDFTTWDWCRAPLRRGAAILYNVARCDGSAGSLALRALAGGGVEEVAPPPSVALPRSLWRVARPTRADAGAAPRLVMAMEDAPFYTRSVIATRLFGEDAVAVHESLDLDRFRHPLVQAMLPFRIPRRWR